MKPFRTNQQVMTWLCFYPADETTSNWKKLSHISVISVILIAMATIVLASGLFFIRHFSSNLELALYAVFQLSSCGCFLYSCISFLLSRHRVPIIFQNLAKIYRLRKEMRFIRFCYSSTQSNTQFYQFLLKCR